MRRDGGHERGNKHELRFHLRTDGAKEEATNDSRGLYCEHDLLCDSVEETTQEKGRY